MKIRAGFVSNSSSSSFTCRACGNTESGWDACLSDFDMVECECGHVLCRSCMNSEGYVDFKFFQDHAYFSSDDQELKSIVFSHKPNEIVDFENQEYGDKLEDLYNELENDCGCHKSYCPLCTLEIIEDSDCLDYYLKLMNKSKTELIKEISDRFVELDELKDFINRA